MTTGTKVFLAFFAVIVGFLVLYYGVWSPGDEPLTTVAKAPVDANPVPDAAQPPLARASGEMPADAPQQPAESPDDTSTPTPSTAASSPPSAVSEPEAQGHPTGPVSIDSRDVIPLVGVSPPAAPPVPAPVPDSVVKANQPVSIAPQGHAGGQQQPTPGNASNSKPSTLHGPPAPQSTPHARSTPPQTTEYIIRSGDTFMSIATDWFGDQTKWSMIAKANPLVDPTRLKIGQKLKLPAKDAQPEPIKQQVAAAADSSHYIVRSGDTLAKIARELYGDVAKWRAIYDANKSLIGSDPANLKTGTKLTLPANLKKTN